MNIWNHQFSKNMNVNIWRISALKYIGQKSFKFFRWYFGKLMNSYIHSDLIWPLVCKLANSGIFSNFQRQGGMAWSLQFLVYLRTLSLNFQKATSKIEVIQSLPCLGWRLEAPKRNRERLENVYFAHSLMKSQTWSPWYQWNYRPHATHCDLKIW